MKLRGVVLALFLLPVAWGLITLLRGAAAHGAPVCPGIATDEAGEEEPAPMRPGFRCTLYDGRTMRITGTRTYEQQKNAQDEQRRHFCTEGALLLTYGLAGLGAVSASYRPWRLPWRRRS